MKKIIKISLLSTVALCNVIFGSNPTEPHDDRAPVLGIVISGVANQSTVTGIELPRIAQVREMLKDIKAGVLPQNILDFF